MLILSCPIKNMNPMIKVGTVNVFAKSERSFNNTITAFSWLTLNDKTAISSHSPAEESKF